MKFSLKLILTISLVSTLAACSVIMDDKEKDTSPQSEMCRYLKRQMTFNEVNNVRDVRYATPSQKKELQQRYEEYGCE